MCLHGCVRVCWGHGITGTSECVAVCCSVLQYVAVCCNVLQYFAVFCSAALCCSVLRCVAVLHCVAVCCRHTCICIFACSTAILYCSFLLIFPYPVSAPSSFHSGGTGAALYPPPPPPPPFITTTIASIVTLQVLCVTKEEKGVRGGGGVRVTFSSRVKYIQARIFTYTHPSVQNFEFQLLCVFVKFALLFS